MLDRRWLRFDPPHATFDCSSREFDSILAEARSTPAADQNAMPAIPTRSSPPPIARDDSPFRLIETINAELAQLASLQRRDRLIQAEREREGDHAERIRRGLMLAELCDSLLSDLSRPLQG